MLSRANRLSLKTNRFRREKEGKTLSSPLFTIVVAPRENSSLPIRFANLISKKLLPLSTDRHQLKRRLTEILRLNLDKLPSGFDILLIPKRNILTASGDQILSDLVKRLSSPT